MFNYQKEVLNKTGNHTLICNWARCLGKTYTIMATILETKPKYVLYVDFNLNNLQDIEIERVRNCGNKLISSMGI